MSAVRFQAHRQASARVKRFARGSETDRWLADLAGNWSRSPADDPGRYWDMGRSLNARLGPSGKDSESSKVSRLLCRVASCLKVSVDELDRMRRFAARFSLPYDLWDAPTDLPCSWAAVCEEWANLFAR